MAQKKKIAYWLLLLTALYLAGAVLSVGESQARYVNTATWYTVAEPTQNKVTSDCLELTTQPPLTVLLGQLEAESREVSFTLGSSADTSGVLTWQVDHPEYLDVRLQLGENSLSSGATVSPTGETPAVVTMRLTPTAKALEPRDGMHVNIQVRFGESLAGTFQVELLPVAQPEPTEPKTTEPETTEPETTEPETTEPEITEPEATEPEITDPEATEPETTEPEITEPEATEPETTEPETTEPETTEPETTEPETTEPETTEPETTEPETTEPEATEPPATITLESVQTYHPACWIPLQVLSDGDTKVSLQLAAGENLQNFPQGTRFSLDKGISWFMLYQEGAIELDVTAATPLTVLLDLSRTALATEPGLTITAGNGVTVTMTAGTAPLYSINTQVLHKDTVIVVTLAELWQNCQPVCSVEVLVVTEEGKTYVPVELSEEGLMAELSGQQLQIRIGETLPPPGTYRLNLRWMDQEICVGQIQTSFFINYAANQNVGGAQQ